MTEDKQWLLQEERHCLAPKVDEIPHKGDGEDDTSDGEGPRGECF